MVNIRPAEINEADFQKAVSVWNAVFPDLASTYDQWLLHNEMYTRTKPVKLFLAESADGKPLAQGVWMQTTMPGKPLKYYVNVTVIPEARRQGIGAALYDAIVAEIMPNNPVALSGDTFEDQVGGQAFMQLYGFEIKQREYESELELATFDPEPHRWAAEKIAHNGLRIVSMADLIAVYSAEGAWRLIYDMGISVMGDVPRPDDSWEPEPVEAYIERNMKQDDFLPEAYLIGMHGDTPAGLCQLWKRKAAPDSLYQGLTGTARGYRRMGLATAMKVRNIEWAIQQGYKRIRTGNEINNPMYQINVQLGFTNLPSFLIYECNLT